MFKRSARVTNIMYLDCIPALITRFVIEFGKIINNGEDKFLQEIILMKTNLIKLSIYLEIQRATQGISDCNIYQNLCRKVKNTLRHLLNCNLHGIRTGLCKFYWIKIKLGMSWLFKKYIHDAWRRWMGHSA